MKAYIVSKGCALRIRTHLWLRKCGLPYEWVTHTKQMASVIARLDDAPIHVSKAEDLVSQRNWIITRVVPFKHWYVGLDDNIECLTMVHPRLYREERLDVEQPPPAGFATWRAAYRHLMPVAYVLPALENLVRACVRHGTPLGGFASNENPMFRKPHWSYRRFVKTKFFVMQNVGLRFKHNYAHDSYLSAKVIAEYGKVVVNNFVHAVHPWYEAGGLGSVRERAEPLEAQLAEIVAEFPGLVARAPGAHSALRMLRTSDAAVAHWQRQHATYREKSC
jgi:hypothetical protein